jgi:hypothetical protein
VLRHHHTRRSLRKARRTLLLAWPLLLAGCSLSLVDSEAPPETTGSIAPAVEVQRPLPQTLAYSDAARIGQAASAVLSEAGTAPQDWINVATGSSGTLDLPDAGSRSDNCRPFSTIVTSIGGVHRYSGAICQKPDGRPIVQLGDGDDEARS